jgi:hypothetical protein
VVARAKVAHREVRHRELWPAPESQHRPKSQTCTPHEAESKGRAIRNASLSYVLALSALFTVAVRPAWADARCAPIAGGGARLGAVDAHLRLQFVDRALRHGARRARQWAWSWAGIYSGLTTYNLIRLDGADSAGRIDDLVGASASAVGLLALTIKPLKVMSDQRRLERRLRLARPDEDVCAQLAYAEQLLVRDAASEKLGVGALTQAGSFAFNLGVSLLLGLGFGHWSQAALTGLIGIGVGELQIITQPTDVVDALARYQGADLGPSTGWLRGWALAPILGRDRAGFALAISF